MRKISPESPINLMVKTHGFPVQIFPNKPIQWGNLKFPLSDITIVKITGSPTVYLMVKTHGFPVQTNPVIMASWKPRHARRSFRRSSWRLPRTRPTPAASASPCSARRPPWSRLAVVRDTVYRGGPKRSCTSWWLFWVNYNELTTSEAWKS